MLVVTVTENRASDIRHHQQLTPPTNQLGDDGLSRDSKYDALKRVCLVCNHLGWKKVHA